MGPREAACRSVASRLRVTGCRHRAGARAGSAPQRPCPSGAALIAFLCSNSKGGFASGDGRAVLAKQLEKCSRSTSWPPCEVENIPNMNRAGGRLPGRTGVWGLGFSQRPPGPDRDGVAALPRTICRPHVVHLFPGCLGCSGLPEQIKLSSLVIQIRFVSGEALGERSVQTAGEVVFSADLLADTPSLCPSLSFSRRSSSRCWRRCR